MAPECVIDQEYSPKSDGEEYPALAHSNFE
jgi:hypothetical protein